MEGQSITLKIAGKEYPLKASTPEMEQLMRIAASEINAMLAKYKERYPDKSELDKLAFVTLNEAVGKLSAQRSAAKVVSETEKLGDSLGAYLAAIKK